MKKRRALLLLVFLFATTFYIGVDYGHKHRTRAEWFKMIWEDGRGFEKGWSACEQTYDIKWMQTNGWNGWVCGRRADPLPPGWMEHVIATNRYER